MNLEQFKDYLVDTQKLRNIIFAPGTPRVLSRLIWTKLSAKAIQEDGVDSFQAGMDLMDVLNTYKFWKPQLIKIMEDCRDMNKLPLVKVKGQEVDGSKVTFKHGSILGPGVKGLVEGENP